MKTIFIPLSAYLFLMCMCISNAEPVHLPSNSVFSEVRDNVFVGFWNGERVDKGTNEVIEFSTDKQIKYGFSSTQSVPYDVYALNEEYGYVISAKSESGLEIDKTHYGNKFGVAFLNVTNIDRKQFDYTKGRGNGGYQFPYLSTASPSGLMLSRDLPPLEDIFKFEKPGKYIVTIQLQCFIGPYGKSNATNVDLIRFPPVKLQVIKNDDGKGN